MLWFWICEMVGQDSGRSWDMIQIKNELSFPTGNTQARKKSVYSYNLLMDQKSDLKPRKTEKMRIS